MVDLVTTPAQGVLDVLAASSRLLEKPEEYRAALRPLTGVLVPSWAEACAIALRNGKGVVELAGSTGHGIDKALVTRRPASGIEVKRGSGGWTLEVPIVVRGDALGVLWMRGKGDQPPPLLPPLAEEMSRRIALAVDSARSIAREHRVAETLQRALLPETLPASPLVRMRAAYRPATTESIVGGDWYDAFELPDGRIGISIGDVAGHGLSAAVVMGDARQAVRGAAFHASSPGEVLAQANAMLQAAPMMVTALYAVFDPRESTFTYASAGHPPPLVHLAGGRSYMLPSGDFPLGVDNALLPPSWTFTLQPGTLLLLYTDGIIEYSRDLMLGERRLFEAVAAEYDAGSDNPAQAVQDRIFADATNNDDVATLTLEVAPRQLDGFDCVVSAVPLAVPFVRASLERFLDERSVGADKRFALVTAIGEALANAVEHAYTDHPGTMRLRVRVDGRMLRVQIEDGGVWRPGVRDDEGGRGIPMMRALMDRVEIRTDRANTQIRMQLQIA